MVLGVGITALAGSSAHGHAHGQPRPDVDASRRGGGAASRIRSAWWLFHHPQVHVGGLRQRQHEAAVEQRGRVLDHRGQRASRARSRETVTYEGRPRPDVSDTIVTSIEVLTPMRNHRGFSLVELLVVLMIMAIVTGGIYKLLNTTQRLSRAQAERMDLQSNVRVASIVIPNELREINAVIGRHGSTRTTSWPCRLGDQHPVPGHARHGLRLRRRHGHAAPAAGLERPARRRLRPPIRSTCSATAPRPRSAPMTPGSAARSPATASGNTCARHAGADAQHRHAGSASHIGNARSVVRGHGAEPVRERREVVAGHAVGQRRRRAPAAAGPARGQRRPRLHVPELQRR